MQVNTQKIETLVHELLREIGEDPQREGLVKTPNASPRRWLS
jgi:GTP cyclohydrolase I